MLTAKPIGPDLPLAKPAPKPLFAIAHRGSQRAGTLFGYRMDSSHYHSWHVSTPILAFPLAGGRNMRAYVRFRRCSESSCISPYTPVARLICETGPFRACAPFRSRRNGPVLRRKARAGEWPRLARRGCNTNSLRSRRFFHKSQSDCDIAYLATHHSSLIWSPQAKAAQSAHDHTMPLDRVRCRRGWPQ